MQGMISSSSFSRRAPRRRRYDFNDPYESPFLVLLLVSSWKGSLVIHWISLLEQRKR